MDERTEAAMEGETRSFLCFGGEHDRCDNAECTCECHGEVRDEVHMLAELVKLYQGALQRTIAPYITLAQNTLPAGTQRLNVTLIVSIGDDEPLVSSAVSTIEEKDRAQLELGAGKRWLEARAARTE